MTYRIPVVDLEAALGESPPAGVLDDVRAAIEQAGIVQVTNHGVDQGLIDEFGERTGRLLARPRPEKAKLASLTGHPYRGWRQWPDDFGRLELERYNVAQFDTPQDARAGGVPEQYLALFAHPNVWPPDDPRLRTVTFGYIGACRRLAEAVLSLYARALGVPAGTFPLGAVPHLRLTVNDYPTWPYPEDPDAPDEAKLLLLEHADDSAVTVLGQAGDYEGLQVQAPDGSWVPVPIVPGALQVLSGTLLTRWTGGRLRPGRHRVIAGGADTRRSTAVFCYPSLETVVAPLPPFAAPGTDDAGVLVWDHVRRRVEDYLDEFGRPEQVAAWREGKPYVATLAGNSADRG
ncbi:MAG TPA: 2OG-Fe(II) oxygenase family protein [Streptosporangiaceae bacterium]|nr:2OG-Fe(II) oxygenase family protein [Streptosporangiaceae bacterium]